MSIKIKGATSPVPEKQFEVSLFQEGTNNKQVDIKVKVFNGTTVYDYWVLRLIEENGRLIAQRIQGLTAGDFYTTGSGAAIHVKEQF